MAYIPRAQSSLEEALERVDHDEKMFSELLSLFFNEDLPKYMSSIMNGIESQNYEQVEESAHAIKSALGSLGSVSGSEQALLLERRALAHELTGVEELLENLSGEIQAFKDLTEKFNK